MKNNRTAFVLPSLNLILCGLLFAIALCGLLAQVSLRQEITRTAQSIENNERQLRDLERRNQFLSTRLAEAHRPDVLLERMGDQLIRPRDQQVIWVRSGGRSLADRGSVAYSQTHDLISSLD